MEFIYSSPDLSTESCLACIDGAITEASEATCTDYDKTDMEFN